MPDEALWKQRASSFSPWRRPSPIISPPWAVAFLPDGRALVTERAGRVRIVSKEMKLADEPALVASDIRAWLKMGLLGIAIDPDFAANGFVYVAINYGDDKQEHSGEKWMRVVRYSFRDNHLVEPKTLVGRIPAFWNHTGGRLKFGPDGKLYITTGDADNPPNAQDKTSLSGKILRINTDGSAPNDNPFFTAQVGNAAIWSYGHRNPQGLDWRPKDSQLYAPEHGPNGGEEINRGMPTYADLLSPDEINELVGLIRSREEMNRH